MHNSFCHIELASDDPKKAQEFYGKMFDWKFTDHDMGDHGTYTILDTGVPPAGGIYKNMVPNAPSHWLTYIQVEDIEASTKQAVELGATLLKDVDVVPDMGKFSVIADPTGAAFAMWEPAAKE